MLVNPLFVNPEIFTSEFNNRIYQKAAKPKLLKKVESDDLIQFQIFKLDGDFTDFEFKLVKLNDYEGLLTVFSEVDNFKVSIKLNLSKVDIHKINFELDELSDQILNLNIPKYVEFNPADLLNDCFSAFFNPLLRENLGGAPSSFYGNHLKEHERELKQQEKVRKEQEKIRKQQDKLRKEQEKRQREYEERIRKEQARRQKEYEERMKKEQERIQKEYEERIKKEQERRQKEYEARVKKEQEERKQREKQARLQKIREEKLRKQEEEAAKARKDSYQSDQEKVEEFMNHVFQNFFPFQNPQFYSQFQQQSNDTQRATSYAASSSNSSKPDKVPEPVPDPEVSEPIAEVVAKSPTPQPEIESPASSGRSSPVQAPKTLKDNNDMELDDDNHSINSDEVLVSPVPGSPHSNNSLHKSPSIEEVEDEEFVMLRKKFGQ